MAKKTPDRGFTVIELLVVISIVSTLSSIALVSFQSARERGRLGSAIAFAGQLYRVAGAGIGGYWKFDSGAGDLGKDSGPLALNGVSGVGVSESNETPYGIGKSASFTGQDDSNIGISIVNSPIRFSSAMGPGNSFVFAAWFKSTGPSPALYDGYAIGRLGWSTGVGIGNGTNVSKGNVMGTFAVHESEDETVIILDGGVRIDDDKWHYIAMIVDDRAKRGTLYLDGKQVDQEDYAGKNLLDKNLIGSFKIGTIGNGWGIRGLVDDAMFFTLP